MTHPILVTGAAGGTQGSTGRLVASLLMEQGIPVRALVHKLDARSDEIRKRGAEVVEGDLLSPASVQAALRNVKRAYFTYPVADGLLEAATIFAAAARDASLELVVNNSQFQGGPGIPPFAIFNMPPAVAICSIDWPIASSTGRRLELSTSRRRPTMKTCALLSAGAWPRKNTVFLPWGEDTTIVPLAGAQDVSRVAATLLANPGAPPQSVYALVSETPTVREMTETLGRAVGRPIRYVAITDEQWTNAVKERINPHALDHLTHLWQYFRQGEERFQATDAILIVTGRDPQTLEEFFKANARAIDAGQS